MTSRSYGGGGQGFCDNSTKLSIIKCVTIGEGGQKNVQSCVTSFMDVLLGQNEFKKTFNRIIDWQISKGAYGLGET